MKNSSKLNLIRIMTILLLIAILPVQGSFAAPSNGEIERKGTVTFSVSALGDEVPTDPRIQLNMMCGNNNVAKANLRAFGKNTHSSPFRTTDTQLCEIHALSDKDSPLGNEVIFTIRNEDDVIARRVVHPAAGSAESTPFYVSEGNLFVDVSQEFTSSPLGTPIRVMEWNILNGGRDAGGAENVNQMIEAIRHHNPDILFLVETYSSGEIIAEGLNAGVPEDEQYHAIQISRDPDREPGLDNLWIFSRFPVKELFPILKSSAYMADYHFGGVKVQLPDGQELNLFDTWIHHEGGAVKTLNQTVGEITYGLPRTYTNTEILATDTVYRLGMIRKILNGNLPTYLKGDPSPVIMAGDFNTLSRTDWSERFADAPGHGGLVLPWAVTGLIEDYGFTDSYRWAHPDARLNPGGTLIPDFGFRMIPARIDYIWTLGEQIRILNSQTFDKRLPGHEMPGYSFYSDHAALITDLVIRNKEVSLPNEPEPSEGIVPKEKMKAIATSQHTGYEASKAIDSKPETMWHSEWSPIAPLPQSITLDLGGVYEVTGLDYQTRTDFKPDGVITQYTVYASSDGIDFTNVTSGAWEQDYYSKSINFNFPNARYIRLEAIESSGGVASAAEISIRHKLAK
ncbi:discoidin domain-containing protein [Paenibacillus dakarensis]|uniref:discoidin domain-containing protein n=1 Tax=Paenibacillus dakarensis TaxID=1527293 RepID=UPI00147977FC|nr:discoidin domain-containing protein [Paenibacillus dakarensis]